MLLLFNGQTGENFCRQFLGHHPEDNHRLLRVQLLNEGSDIHLIHLHQLELQLPVPLIGSHPQQFFYLIFNFDLFIQHDLPLPKFLFIYFGNRKNNLATKRTPGRALHRCLRTAVHTTKNRSTLCLRFRVAAI